MLSAAIQGKDSVLSHWFQASPLDHSVFIGKDRPLFFSVAYHVDQKSGGWGVNHHKDMQTYAPTLCVKAEDKQRVRRRPGKDESCLV